jgi:hypothetical protein
MVQARTESKRVSAFERLVHPFKWKVSSSVTCATQFRSAGVSNRGENPDKDGPGPCSIDLELISNPLEVTENGLGPT